MVCMWKTCAVCTGSARGTWCGTLTDSQIASQFLQKEVPPYIVCPSRACDCTAVLWPQGLECDYVRCTWKAAAVVPIRWCGGKCFAIFANVLVCCLVHSSDSVCGRHGMCMCGSVRVSGEEDMYSQCLASTSFSWLIGVTTPGWCPAYNFIVNS